MNIKRSSGILLHISSLPSNHGIGDLGYDAYKFVDWLVTAKQSYWQVLPINIANDEGCPYSSCSAFGGYHLLISPEKLVEDKLLNKSDLDIRPEFTNKEHVNFSLVTEYKNILFQKAYNNFKSGKIFKKDFSAFIEREKDWLHDLAMYQAIFEQLGGFWPNWPPSLKNRETKSLEKFYKINQDRIDYHKFLQFIFFYQWDELRRYANARKIKLIGDIPIFVSHGSMDVWKNPEMFKLTGDLPYVVTGAPPDDFSPMGQRWGNPNYDWWQLEQTGFHWWKRRVSHLIDHFDLIRIDHFRGFAATWEIPYSTNDPRNGYWSFVPGHNLFHCLREHLGGLPIIAEDLGKITPDVVHLRESFGLAGMKILQFAFGEGDFNVNLPHNYHTDNCVVYTGTHDNETTIGRFKDMGNTLEKQYMMKYVRPWNLNDINWSFIELAMKTRAILAITPLQDIIGLDNRARINTPGNDKGNWTWRFIWNQITTHNTHHLSELTFHSGRSS